MVLLISSGSMYLLYLLCLLYDTPSAKILSRDFTYLTIQYYFLSQMDADLSK